MSPSFSFRNVIMKLEIKVLLFEYMLLFTIGSLCASSVCAWHSWNLHKSVTSLDEIHFDQDFQSVLSPLTSVLVKELTPKGKYASSLL